jgi:uncharacterized oxidoreductase
VPEVEAVAGRVAPADELRAYARDLLLGVGSPEAVAARVAEGLVSANLAGHDSHGVQLVPYYAELVASGQIRLDVETEVVVDRGAVVVLDGKYGFGHVVGMEAVALATERAREHGVACVLGRNANHLARLGEYTWALAEAGLASILLVNCQGGEQLVPPFGGAEPRLTNNPVSFCAPAGTHPALVDMALSVAAEAKVWLAAARGVAIPEGWIVDGDGNPTTDPTDLGRGGMLLPVGAHKGYALIVLVDILAGILSGGGACRADPPEVFSNAFLLVAVDVEPLRPRAEYDREVEALRSHVKTAPSAGPILFPGEFELESATRREREGIPIEPRTWEALAELARRVGVEPL